MRPAPKFYAGGHAYTERTLDLKKRRVEQRNPFDVLINSINNKSGLGGGCNAELLHLTIIGENMAPKDEKSLSNGFGMVRKYDQKSSEWWRSWGEMQLCDVRNRQGFIEKKLHPVLKVNLINLSVEARLTLFEIRGAHEAATPEDVAQTFNFRNNYTPDQKLQCLRKGLAELSEIGVVRITGKELNGKIPFDVHPSVMVVSYVMDEDQFKDTANALRDAQEEAQKRNGKIIITGK